MDQSYSKFIKYYNLNEISKFSNFNNLHLLSSIKSISVWYSIDLSLEKSRLFYYSKSLLAIFLIYLITNKYPKIQSTKDRRIIYIESNLVSLDLVSFLEKFLIVSSLKQKKNIVRNLKSKGKFFRFLVTDLNMFTDLSGFISFFGLIDWLHIDMYFNHEEDYRNFLFLDNLIKSSYLI